MSIQGEMVRIYIGGICQETNTFSPKRTTIDDFRRGYYLRGEEVMRTLGNTDTEIGGFLEHLSRLEKVSVLPGIAAWAVASGTIVREAFDSLSSELLGSIEEALPVDGVLLSLHGALVCEDEDDCEGELLGKIRSLVGTQVPIVSTLDYHANVTGKMLESASALIGYRTYPHMDYKDTGWRASELVCKLSERTLETRSAFRRLPLILPVDNTETRTGPMSPVIRYLEELENDSAILSASLFCPHPWLDIADYGPSILIYYRAADGKSPIISSGTSGEFARVGGRTPNGIGDAVGRYIWDSRKEFFPVFPDISQFTMSLGHLDRPIIAVDSGDIMSAGGIGDSTVFLRALLEGGSGIRAVIPLVDPESVAQAFDIGEGGQSEFYLGGSDRPSYNSRVRVRASIRRLSSEDIHLSEHSFSGLGLKVGKRACLEVGDSLNVILSEYATLVHDPEFVRSMGVSPEDSDLIVQKTHKLFRAAYAPIARTIAVIDTPGITDREPLRLRFHRVPRPIYPLDEMSDIFPMEGLGE